MLKITFPLRDKMQRLLFRIYRGILTQTRIYNHINNLKLKIENERCIISTYRKGKSYY